MCREDDVREVRGVVELIFPSWRHAEEGTGGFVLCGIGLAWLSLASWICEVKPNETCTIHLRAK